MTATTTPTTTTTAQPKTVTEFLSAEFQPQELTTPDTIYFSMREQRYREIILLHLRMFLRNVNSHLLAHFKDFVLTRDDFPPLPTNTGVLSDDYGLTLTDILTKINLGEYLSIREYLCDVDLIVAQTKIRFNLSTDIGSIMIQRVCALQDVALTLCLGFDLQIAAACELIAKELRLKQQLIFTQLMKLHYSNPKVNPPIVLHNVKLFGHVFKHDSLLMISDLRKHVQSYITQQQSRRLLKLQQDKIIALNPMMAPNSSSSSSSSSLVGDVVGTTSTTVNDSDGSTMMKDDDYDSGVLPTKPQKRSLPPNDRLLSSSPASVSNNTLSTQQPGLHNQQVPLETMLYQINFLIQQLNIFSPAIDVPTLESLHQQLLHCLFATPFQSSSELYEHAQARILTVLKRFLTFCRKNDELHFDLFFTPLWVDLCAAQKREVEKVGQ